MEPADRLEARLGDDGWLREVGRWTLPDGAEVRVVRWALRDAARTLVAWARGQGDLGDDGAWSVGVALERRDAPTGKWQSVRRQEDSTDNPDALESRLRGWEHGLVDRARK